MKKSFYSSDGNFYKLQNIENFIDNPYHIKIKLFSDFGEKSNIKYNEFLHCENCIRNNGNGWDGNLISVYKLNDDGTIDDSNIPFLLKNIGLNFNEGKETNFIGGNLYPGNYVLKI